MTTFVDAVGGYSTTTGTGTYSITGNISGMGAFSDEDDGAELTVYAVMGSDYEIVTGLVGSSGTTFTRVTVHKSSNSNAAVNWGAGTKRLEAVSTSKMLRQWAVQFANKPPGEAILIASSGQSNMRFANFRVNQTAPDSSTGIWDYSTDGTEAFDRADLAFRNVDPSDEYLYGTIHVGTSRKAERSPSTFQFTENIPYATALELERLTGRPVCIVNATRAGTAIDYAEGWVYDPGSDNVLDVWSEEIANAIANPPTGVTLPASPDIVIFAQGGSDALAEQDSGRYGHLLEQMILDCEDSNRYGWADPEKTHWYLVEISPELQEEYQTFNGHAVADDLTPDYVHLVPTHGAITTDGLHYTGEDAAMLGRRIARMVSTGVAGSKSGLGGTRARKLFRELSSISTAYLYGGASDSAPDSGDYNDNAGHTKLRIHKTDGNPFGAQDQSESGIHSLHRDGCVITIAQSSNAANYREYTVDTLPVDMGDYWEWDVSAYDEGGTPPTGSTGSSLSASRLVFDGTSILARSGLQPSSDQLLEADTLRSYIILGDSDANFKYRNLIVDGDGAIYPLGGMRRMPHKIQKTLDVTGSSLVNIRCPENSHMYAKVTVVGKNSTTNQMYVAVAQTVGYRVTGAWQSEGTKYDVEFAATGFSLAWDTAAGNSTALELTTTSNNTEVWEFNLEIEVMTVDDA
tara:strand:+ start:38803 stop:40863 length:2061 start_codon:yes stop_codon:yes gene_type:complete